MADLLLALDVKGKEKAVAVAEACAGEIDAIKIGYPLVLSAGLGVVKELAKFGTPIIADFKVSDIPVQTQKRWQEWQRLPVQTALSPRLPARREPQSFAKSSEMI